MSTTPVSPAPDQTQLDPNQAPASGNVVGGVPGIAQPSVQAASPTTNAQAVSQVAQQPVSQPTLAQQHTGWFHSMLARMNQGDQVPLRDRAGNPVVDPQTGQVKTQPLTSKQMGRSILAGVLSAMAATEQHQPYRNGNGIFVNPSNEAVAAGDQAFQAGRPRNQIAQAQAQATSQRTQQYAVYDANMKMLAQTQQLYQLKGAQMKDAVDHYKDLSDQFAAGGIVNPETGDSLYDPNYANMTPQEAEDHLKKGDITRDLMFPVSVEPIIGQDGQPTGQSQLRWAAIKGPSNIHVTQAMIDRYPELTGIQVGASMPTLQYLKLARTSADNSSLGSMIQNVADAQVAANMPGAKPVNFNWDQFKRDARLTPDQMHQMHGLAGMAPDEFMSKIRAMDSASGGAGRLAEALSKQGITVDDNAWKNKRAADLEAAKDEGDKKPAPEGYYDGAFSLAKRSLRDPVAVERAIEGLPKTGGTVGQVKNASARIDHEVEEQNKLDIARQGLSDREKAANPVPSSGSAPFAYNWADPKTGTNYDLTSAPTKLVDGTMDPTQLTKRSKNYDQTNREADAYSRSRYGVPFDMAQASTDYKYANQKSTRDTLNMVQALTGESKDNNGGSLLQLQQQFNALGNIRVPKVNELANWASQNAGNDAVTNFKGTLLGVVDEMGKILGGGVATDSSRQEARDIIDQNFSQNQGKGAINSIRALMANRQNAMVGKNRYLLNDYGKVTVPTVGGQGGQAQTVSVQIPGQPAGRIAADKVAAFKAKYPNAVIGQ